MKHEALSNLISPNNQMPQEQMDEAEASGKAIVTLGEGDCMLHMIVADLAAGKDKDNPEEIINIMASIVYNVKNNTIELRGRFRFENSGNKKGFYRDPEPYTKEGLEELKKFANNMPSKMKVFSVFHLLETPTILEFKIGESSESIIKKLNDTNKFNISFAKK